MSKEPWIWSDWFTWPVPVSYTMFCRPQQTLISVMTAFTHHLSAKAKQDQETQVTHSVLCHKLWAVDYLPLDRRFRRCWCKQVAQVLLDSHCDFPPLLSGKVTQYTPIGSSLDQCFVAEWANQDLAISIGTAVRQRALLLYHTLPRQRQAEILRHRHLHGFPESLWTGRPSTAFSNAAASMGIKEGLFPWLANFLYNRLQAVRVQDQVTRCHWQFLLWSLPSPTHIQEPQLEPL